MRTINANTLAELQATEMRPFMLLEMVIDGTAYRYTNCDVPLYSGRRVIGDILRENCSALGAWADGDNNATSTQETFGGEKTFKFFVASAGSGNLARRTISLGDVFNTQTSIEIKVYNDLIGVRGDIDYFRLQIRLSTTLSFLVGFASDGLYVSDGPSWNEVGTNIVDQNAWSTWRFVINHAVEASATVDIYKDNVLQAQEVDCSETGSGWTAGDIELTQYGYTINNAISYVDYLKIDDGLVAANSEAALFTPLGFTINPISYSLANIVDQAQIVIDNLDQIMTSVFVGGTPQGETATISFVAVDSSGAVIGAPLVLFEGEIDSWGLDEEKLNVTLTNIFSQWSRQTVALHSASCRWKVFKGTECGYAGGGTWCDRSYSRCSALGNTANFGGFRFIPAFSDKPIIWGPKENE